MTELSGDLRNVWPHWVPDQLRNYIRHVNGGQSIRGLARDDGGHASTVLRQLRQIETRREDPLADEALTWIVGLFPRLVSDRDGEAARSTDPTEVSPKLALKEIDAALPGVLRRLSQKDAVLAYAQSMDRAVIVRDREDGETTRLGVVDRPVMLALVLTDWIEPSATRGSGKIARFRISAAGRTALNHMVAQAENQAGGFEEPRSGFAGKPRQRPVCLMDTPVLQLSRRRSRSGDPFLAAPLVRAAERIQQDFELAMMEPRGATNWDAFLTAGVSGGPGDADPLSGGPMAARDRVCDALRALGPGLGDVVLECCCRLQGLEAAERKLGWSARSGKIVLRIALQRLRQHYDGLKDGGGLIG